jgi:Zinc finger, C3HC4 type (RING finger)/B-box zinc finger
LFFVVKQSERMAEASLSVKTTLADVLECPICAEVFSDPRSLPCVHSFCLKCIKTWNKDKLPGSEVACPVCRVKFTIPEDGVDGLPKNIFIAKLLLVKESPSSDQASPTLLCEVCSVSCMNPDDQKVASMYCVDCEQKLCKSCAAVHENFKVSRHHKQLPLDEQTNPKELAAKNSPAFCGKHMGEQLKIYCTECKVALCAMCFIEQHNSHGYSDVVKMADELRRQMSTDVDGLGKTADSLRAVLTDLNKGKEAYNRRMADVESEICEEARKLVARVESDKQKLLDQLAEEKRNRMKQVEQLHADVEQQILLVEGLQKYAGKLTNEGTPNDILQDSNTVHGRASELMKQDKFILELKRMGPANISYTSSKTLSANNSNVVGRIHCSKGEPSLLYFDCMFIVQPALHLNICLYVERLSGAKHAR